MPQTVTEWTGKIAVRIPRNGGDTLASDASRRLQRTHSIKDVEIVELVGIEPGLSATVAEFELGVSTTGIESADELQAALESTAGTERVAHVSRA